MSTKTILTNAQVAKAIYVDADFDSEILEGYAKAASSLIRNKTGYDFAEDAVIEPLAVLCAELYIRQIHFGSDGYNKEHDYNIGISGLLKTLEDIAHAKDII